MVAVDNGPDFFPSSKLNQNYIENNGEDNGIINGLLTGESMASGYPCFEMVWGNFAKLLHMHESFF